MRDVFFSFVQCFVDDNLFFSCQGRELVVKGHNNSVDQVAWNPSQLTELATSSADKTLQFWDIRSKHEILSTTCVIIVSSGFFKIVCVLHVFAFYAKLPPSQHTRSSQMATRSTSFGRGKAPSSCSAPRTTCCRSSTRERTKCCSRKSLTLKFVAFYFIFVNFFSSPVQRIAQSFVFFLSRQKPNFFFKKIK